MSESFDFLPPAEIPDERLLFQALGFENSRDPESVDAFRDCLLAVNMSQPAIENLLGFGVLDMTMARIREMNLVKEQIYELLEWVYDHRKSAYFRVAGERSSVVTLSQEPECKAQPDSLGCFLTCGEKVFHQMLVERGVEPHRAQLIWQIGKVFSVQDIFDQLEPDVHDVLRQVLRDLGISC